MNCKRSKYTQKRFTIGIVDDVSYQSLETKESLDLTEPQTFQAKFWGFDLTEQLVQINQPSRLSGITQTNMLKAIFIMIRKNLAV